MFEPKEIALQITFKDYLLCNHLLNDLLHMLSITIKESIYRCDESLFGAEVIRFVEKVRNDILYVHFLTIGFF